MLTNATQMPMFGHAGGFRWQQNTNTRKQLVVHREERDNMKRLLLHHVVLASAALPVCVVCIPPGLTTSVYSTDATSL